MSNFRHNLKAFRELAGISGRELANRINVPYPTFNKYESSNVEPKYDVLCQIAVELGVSVDALLGYVPSPTSWQTDSLLPLIEGSEINMVSGSEEVQMTFRGQAWTIPAEEVQDILSDAQKEAKGRGEREILYRRLLEYFASHAPNKKSPACKSKT